ncbi:MAG TPA: YtxH domain-containing protein [Chitinophagaceae bacterium]|nr:YtxH domain-containing protein [Chitinophagaceae bacterium]
MRNKQVTIGFFAGLVAGALAAILFAPQSGAETRKKIADTSGDIKDAVKDGVLAFIEKLQKGVDEEVNRQDIPQLPRMNQDII